MGDPRSQGHPGGVQGEMGRTHPRSLDRERSNCLLPMKLDSFENMFQGLHLVLSHSLHFQNQTQETH